MKTKTATQSPTANNLTFQERPIRKIMEHVTDALFHVEQSTLSAESKERIRHHLQEVSAVIAPKQRCPDCGQEDEFRGHQTCQYPTDEERS